MENIGLQILRSSGSKRVDYRKKSFKQHALPFLAGIALAVSIVPTSGHAQSLKQVLSQSVAAHPEYRALSANRRAIGEELTAARGLGLPGVNVEARYGNLDDDNTSQDYNEWSVVLKQPLYDGGKTVSEVSRQSQRVQSAGQRVRDTGNTIGLQIAQAYLEVSRARHVLGIARANEKAIRHIVGKVNSRVELGAASTADKELALSRLYAAQNITAESEIRLEDARALYITITEQKPGKLEPIKLSRKHFPKNLGTAISHAKSASPKILAMQYDALASEFAIGTAKSAIMPKVDLELSANHRDRIQGTSAENTSYKAMVVFSMSLYNGGINAARIREAEHRADEARDLADAAALNVEREIRLAWNTYTGAPKKVKALNAQATSSLRVKNLRKKQYEAGTSSLIAILDAQNEYVIAKVQAINENSMRKFAYFKVLAATGTLLDAYGIDGVDEDPGVDHLVVTSSIAIPSLAPSKQAQRVAVVAAKPAPLVSAQAKRERRKARYVSDR
ncbi:MAG: TolC family protein [Pseudomonadota bacterium]